MAKKIILALIVLILVSFFIISHFNTDYVNVYIDGENVSVEGHVENRNMASLNNDICDLTLDVMNDSSSNVSTLKKKIVDLCHEDVEVNIDSSIGADQIPVVVCVDGTSMLPTLKSGQKVLLNKTHDVHVGDIVVSESEYGGIIKRIGDIRGSKVYLESDNKNISYEYVDGVLYEVKGISTWVDISDINGVVIDY